MYNTCSKKNLFRFSFLWEMKTKVWVCCCSIYCVVSIFYILFSKVSWWNDIFTYYIPVFMIHVSTRFWAETQKPKIRISFEILPFTFFFQFLLILGFHILHSKIVSFLPRGPSQSMDEFQSKCTKHTFFPLKVMFLALWKELLFREKKII